MDTETLAVGAVMRAISRTGRLVPFFNTNDKEPIWDGYVGVYATAKTPHSKNDLLLRVPVQIKGQKGATDEDRISYPVELADLRQYPKENPTVFFVVRMEDDEENDRETIYYHLFTKGHAEDIVRKKGGQDTASQSFQRFPTAIEEKEKLFLDLVESRAATYPEESATSVPLSDTDVFLYNAGIVGFFGRERECETLNAFLSAEPRSALSADFLWWGVIGPGGAGKNRLAYEWAKWVEEQGWTVRFLKSGDYKRLDALAAEHPEPLLLIADYARQHAAELGAWMETLCDAERESPLRLLLLERDEGVDEIGETQWEKELYSAGNEVHLRRARYDRLLQLPALEDTPLKELIAAFAAALRERDAGLPELTEKDADTLLKKLGEIDEELRRPLYAMLLTDAWLRDPAAACWTREELLNQLLDRERVQIRNAVHSLTPEKLKPDEALFEAALRLRRLATALGASGNRELDGLLALDEKLRESLEKKADQYNIPSVEELLLYLGLLRYAGGKLLVPALRPDLLGEYALLHWLTDDARQTEKQSFYAAALQDWELRTFFQRLYADYAPLLNAKPERWAALLPAKLKLDDERASLYTHLLNDGFGRCTDRAQRGCLLKETARLADGIEAETPAAGNIFNNLGLLFHHLGDYLRALEFYKKDLTILEKVYGEEHPDTAASYNNLGGVYHAMGDYPRALEYYDRFRAISEKVYGEEHPDTAASYNNLGAVYKATGDYPRALEYYQKALAIREKILGEEHPDIATSYNNLGTVYDDTGDYPRALEYYQKALAIREKVYGEEHPDTAASYNNLGGVYYATGDYPRALEYHQKALAICEKVYGEEHPDTAIDYNNLGELYRAMGDYPRALEYCQKALAIVEKVEGEEHPHTAASYNNLGGVYKATGNYPRALEYYQNALAICEKVYGEEHPDTAIDYNNLGLVYHTMGDYPRALEYHQKALAIKEKVHGEEHPATAASYNNLGGVYYDMGDYPRALEYYQKELAIREKVYGEEHPDTATSYNNLGVLFYYMGKFQKAREYMQKALTIREKVLGTEHPYTRISREWLEIIEAALK